MPPPPDDDPEAYRDRLKAALWARIGPMVDLETSSKLNTNATPQFIAALTEMVWSHLETTARDLETFARHGGRATVSTDDVLLLTRRNEGLEQVLREFVDAEKAENEKGKARGKKRGD